MVREFTLPDVGEGVAEGELVSWLVEAGESVSEDQPIAEVETDKALVEVPAPVDGTVRELRYEEGAVIPVGEVFITFDVAGEEATPEAAMDGPEPAEPVDGDEPAGAIGDGASSEEPPADRLFAPPRLRRVAREEGIDRSAIDGRGPGGRITTADLQAAVSGRPVEAGGTDESGDTAATDPGDTATTESDWTDSEAAVADPKASVEARSQHTRPTRIESADRDRTLAAPATRRLAREADVDIDAVPTDAERDGEAFVTPEAVQAYATAQQQAQTADGKAIEASESVVDTGTEAEMGTEFAEGERERREPFTGVRKRIAEAMVESASTAPHVTHHDEVDVTALVETRDRLKPRAEEQGIRLTYMPFITKAVVAALTEYPELNAVIDDANDEIVYRDYYTIGVATATDAGLMVPVVENADRKGLLQLASEMDELVTKARERSISPDELQGSTFTITNVGGIGGEYATPILNYPETGILAIGEIKRKPRVVTDERGEESIEPRSVMTLSLSFDHRLIDGAIGAQFTNTVMEYLETPELLLLE